MSDAKHVTKILMDLKTRVPYTVVMTPDAKKVLDIAPLSDIGIAPIWADQNPPNKPAQPPTDGQAAGPQGPAPLTPPFGQTTFCVDASGGSETMDIYTIVWPTKADLNAGKMPHIAVNTLPTDLIKMGIAQFPDSLKPEKQIEAESESKIQDAMSNINKLIGLKNVKDKLRNQIALTRFSKLREEVLGSAVKKPSLHMVFTGNPGTGKTTVAREYGQVLKAMGLLTKGHLVEVTRKDLVAGYVGQSEAKTQKVIESAKGGVLFIDEAYALIVGGSPNDFGKQVVDQIVAEMENNRDDLVVIVAGYPDPMKKFIESNPGLKSRFLNYVEFPDYDGREMGEIMDLMTAEMDIKLTPKARQDAIDVIEKQRSGNGKNFGNGRTVRNLLDLAFENAALRVMESMPVAKIKKLPKEELMSLVTKITVEDIRQVNLDGINSKSGKIGFNTDDLDGVEHKEELLHEVQEELIEKKGNPDAVWSNLASSFEVASPRTIAPSNDDATVERPAVFLSPADRLRKGL